MDKSKIMVTMNMEEYEELNSYRKIFDELKHKVKGCGYIDGMTSARTDVVINMNSVKKLLIDYIPFDCELDGYEIGDINWKLNQE